MCGDFEDWTTGEESALPAGWSVSNSAGTMVAVTTEHAFSGSQSIKVVSAGGGYNRGFLTVDLNEAAPLQQEMFGRMRVYVTDDNANAGDFTFLQIEGTTPKVASGAPEGTEVMYRGRVDQTHDHVFANYDTWLDADADNNSEWETDCEAQPAFTEDMAPPQEYILPKNQWVCVQWHIQQSSDHFDMRLNNQDLIAARTYGTGDGCANGETQQGMWYAPQQFEQLHVGVEQYTENALPRTMYIDDVRVDSAYVGCEDAPTESVEPTESHEEHEHEHEH